MGKLEDECKCDELRHKHTERLREFDRLDLIVHKTTSPEPNKITFVVSGTRCAVCDRLNLFSYSRSVIMHYLCPTKPDMVGLEERLSAVIIEDGDENIRYDAYDLFLFGSSDRIIKEST